MKRTDILILIKKDKLQKDLQIWGENIGYTHSVDTMQLIIWC